MKKGRIAEGFWTQYKLALKQQFHDSFAGLSGSQGEKADRVAVVRDMLLRWEKWWAIAAREQARTRRDDEEKPKPTPGRFLEFVIATYGEPAGKMAAEELRDRNIVPVAKANAPVTRNSVPATGGSDRDAPEGAEKMNPWDRRSPLATVQPAPNDNTEGDEGDLTPQGVQASSNKAWEALMPRLNAMVAAPVEGDDLVALSRLIDQIRRQEILVQTAPDTELGEVAARLLAHSKRLLGAMAKSSEHFATALDSLDYEAAPGRRAKPGATRTPPTAARLRATTEKTAAALAQGLDTPARKGLIYLGAALRAQGARGEQMAQALHKEFMSKPATRTAYVRLDGEELLLGESAHVARSGSFIRRDAQTEAVVTAILTEADASDNPLNRPLPPRTMLALMDALAARLMASDIISFKGEENQDGNRTAERASRSRAPVADEGGEDEEAAPPARRGADRTMNSVDRALGQTTGWGAVSPVVFQQALDLARDSQGNFPAFQSRFATLTDELKPILDKPAMLFWLLARNAPK